MLSIKNRIYYRKSSVSYPINNKIISEISFKEILTIIPFLIIAIFIFLPTNFESGGAECYNEWAAAKMLLNGDGFPVTHISPTYVIYSASLLFLFDYILFILAEFLISSFFLFICMYLSLRTYLSPLITLILCISLMPVFSTVEGHNTTICCGFLFLYLKNYFPFKKDGTYITFLPLQLVLAATFNSFAIPFLIGHFFGCFIQNKKIIFRKEYNLSKFFTIFLLICLYFFANLNQSNRLDNNYFMAKHPYAPIELNSSIELGVFQIAPHFYAQRNYEEKDLLNKDWYFDSPKLLNNAKNLKEALLNSDIIKENILVNIKV